MFSAFFPFAYVRHRLMWHLGPAVSSVRYTVESIFILSNFMLSDALFPEPDAPPHEQTIDNTEKTIHAEIISLLILLLFTCKSK